MLKAINKKTVSLVIASLLSLGLAASANASCGGIYVGGDIGWSDVHQGNFAALSTTALTTASSKSNSDTGLAGRVFGGYQFTQNLAAEMGYTRFHNATSKSSVTNIGITQSTNGTIKEDAVDLVGKAILPLQNGFSLYGKLGVAYLRGENTTKVTTSVPGNGSTTVSVKQNAHKVLPTFGVGAGYDITQNLTADVSYMRIQKTGNSSNLKSTDFVGAGLTYSFG